MSAPVKQPLFEDLHEARPITTATFLAKDKPLLVPAYGCGRDSTALLIELHKRGIRPDLILFADTGGEKPETYAYLPIINEWLKSVDFPTIEVVKKNSPKTGDKSLEDESLRKSLLPSMAYGHHSCSDKWKASPQEIFLNNHILSIRAWRRGEKVIRAIGYESTECSRIEKAKTYIKKHPDKKFSYWYPLQEWGMDLDACIETIKQAGLPVPVKSACFFCPSSKKHEIEWLAENHPDLFLRAIEMEQKAEVTSKRVKGLGRNFAWSSLPCAEPFLYQLNRG